MSEEEHPSERQSLVELTAVLRLVERFEDAWEAGARPDLRAYLPDDESQRPRALVELAHVDLERRLKGGEPARVEDYLAPFPELADDEQAVLGLLVSEFGLRRRHQPDLGLDEFFRRFPSHALLLAERLRADTLPTGADGHPPLTTPGKDRGEPAGPVTSPPGYEILAELGRGGMGVVYKARQQGLNRLVAPKMILAGGAATTEELARFRREAETLGRLQYPHIVQIHEVGVHEGQPFCSLEYLEGGTLAQKLRGPPIQTRESAALLETLTRTLDHAHRAGVVHRDLKPANVLFTADGTPKVSDFGLAKTVNVPEELTASGAILGTPAYMAPEQAQGRGKEVGPAADVWALGAILYECLTGRPPFRGASAADTMVLVLTSDPVRPRQLCPQVPRDLETICLKCLYKLPIRRYPSAAELADDLARWQAGQPIRARPASAAERLRKWAARRPAAAAALTLTLLTAVALALATVLLTLANQRERIARQEADSARQLAEQRELQARQALATAEEARREARQKADVVTATSDFMTELLLGADPVALIRVGSGGQTGSSERKLTARELLDRGRAQLEAGGITDPLVRAAVMDSIGHVYRSLGAHDEADRLLQEGLKLRRHHLGEEHEDVAVSRYHLGWLRQDQGYFAESEKLYRQAMKAMERVLDADDPRLAAVRTNLAWVISHKYRSATPEEAAETEALLREVIRVRRAAVARSGRKEDQRDLGVALAGLAVVMLHKGAKDNYLGTASVLKEMYEHLGQATGGQDATSKCLPEYVSAQFYRKLGDYERAKQKQRFVVEETARALGERHPLHILLLGDYAGLLSQKKEMPEAAHHARRAIELSLASPLRWHPAGIDARIKLADYERSIGNLTEAERLYAEAVEVARRVDAQGEVNRALGKLDEVRQKKEARTKP